MNAYHISKKYPRTDKCAHRYGFMIEVFMIYIVPIVCITYKHVHARTRIYVYMRIHVCVCTYTYICLWYIHTLFFFVRVVFIEYFTTMIMHNLCFPNHNSMFISSTELYLHLQERCKSFWVWIYGEYCVLVLEWARFSRNLHRTIYLDT